MASERAWHGSTTGRQRLVDRYHEATGGVLFRAVDVCHPVDGSETQRSTDIRVFDLADEYDHLAGETVVWSAFDRGVARRIVEHRAHGVELIETGSWGYGGFGSILVKAGILERFWDVGSVERTFIVETSGAGPYVREERPDDEMAEVLRSYDVGVVYGTEL